MRVTSVLAFVLLAAAAVLIGGCRRSASPGGAPSVSASATGNEPRPSASAGAGGASPSATATTPPAIAEPKPVTLVPVSSTKWTRPTEAVVYPLAGGGTGLLVAEQEGVIYEMTGGGQATMVLDLRDRV